MEAGIRKEEGRWEEEAEEEIEEKEGGEEWCYDLLSLLIRIDFKEEI